MRTGAKCTNWDSLGRLKVTQGHRQFDRANVTFYSTLTETVLYRFRDIASYLSKVADCNPPRLHLAPPQGFTPVEFRGGFGVRKLESLGYPVVLFV